MIQDDRRLPALTRPVIWSRVSANAIDTALISAVAALLSLLNTGFVFGIINNVFHLPILAGLYNEPQFHDDAFIQSLRHFSSGIWLLLAGSETHLTHSQWLFLILAYASRVLSFVGFLCCASLVGIHDRRQKILFSLLICFLPFLDGYSSAGAGGLFLNYFTHSEIANGTMLLAIYYAARSRFAAMGVAVGATLFINVFMAVWLVPPLSLILAIQLAAGETDVRTVMRRGLVALIPVAILALPIVFNIASNPEFGKPISFDFIDYLHRYFAVHFLIDSISLVGLLVLGALTITTTVALVRLGSPARELQAAFAGAVMVYMIGAVLPYVTHNPQFLELHLLRSSTMIHLLAAVALAALATKWICAPDNQRLFLPGCLLALALCALQLSFVLCIPIILMANLLRREEQPNVSPILGYLALGFLIALVWPLAIRNHLSINRQYEKGLTEWTQIGRWALRATPTDAIFLTPAGDVDASPAARNGHIKPSTGSAIFEFVSHRRVWVDFRRGAAVMWTPSYYAIWRSRIAAVAPLATLDDRMTYASRNKLGYVIDGCDSAKSGQKPAFRTERLCVFASNLHPEQ